MGDIVTPLGKVRTGLTPQGYMHELAAERITGMPAVHFATAAMERGNELEPEARSYYEMQTGCTVQEVGLCMPDHGRWACSPDGLVGDDGGLEIKCPMPKAHISALLDQGASYAIQVQASLWITGRAWWDLLIYTDVPQLPNVITRIEPDPRMHAAFDEALPAFCDELDALTERLIALGCGADAMAAHDAAWEQGLDALIERIAGEGAE